ncbi:MAG: MoxR family ATPase, partial [Candidatus Taylorbacteria bacterium]|nr:MoxR family ATPase [Candidatus Taylorbacteria bacterium]
MSERQPAPKREKPGREPFIVEKDESVSYLGVEVPKGEGGPLVPGRQESENYFYTEEDYLLRREMATSIALNKPILFEGGTGIGKTSAVAAMCAELNLNFCKVSFARDMAIEDVIGGKTIVKEGDAEVVKWYDGNLMVAIRHGGIALLDEYNFQGSKVGSRVNPVIDAILNGRKEISLPENDNERVMVHPNFRLVAAQNPPGTEEGQEFTGREQMSAETFGRWTFNKLPLEMSRDMRDKRLAGMM